MVGFSEHCCYSCFNFSIFVDIRQDSNKENAIVLWKSWFVMFTLFWMRLVFASSRPVQVLGKNTVAKVLVISSEAA